MPQDNDNDDQPKKERWRRSTTLPLNTMPSRASSRRVSPINVEVINSPEARAHELMFGKGARMDVGTPEDWQREIGALGRPASDDEVAMAMRPRAWNNGRDIRLRRLYQNGPQAPVEPMPAPSDPRDIHLPAEPPGLGRLKLNQETPMPDDKNTRMKGPRNTQPGAGTLPADWGVAGDNWLNPDATRIAHQIIFGKGAMMSPRDPADEYGWSPDIKAMERRPKAPTYKQDINLPAEPRGTARGLGQRSERDLATREAIIQQLGERPPGVAPAIMQSPAGAEHSTNYPEPSIGPHFAKDAPRLKAEYDRNIEKMWRDDDLYGQALARSKEGMPLSAEQSRAYKEKGQRDKASEAGSIRLLAQAAKENPDILKNLSPGVRTQVMAELARGKK